MKKKAEKQSTRLKKVYCRHCGYTARVTQKWLDLGVPACPTRGCKQQRFVKEHKAA